jgi:hypothetical protein
MRLRRKATKLDVQDLLEIAVLTGVPGVGGAPALHDGPAAPAEAGAVAADAAVPAADLPAGQPFLRLQRLPRWTQLWFRTRPTRRRRARRECRGNRTKSRMQRRMTAMLDGGRGAAALRLRPRAARVCAARLGSFALQGPGGCASGWRCGGRKRNRGRGVHAARERLSRAFQWLPCLVHACHNPVPHGTPCSFPPPSLAVRGSVLLWLGAWRGESCKEP